MELSISGCDDLVWVGAPDEWLGFGVVVFCDEAVDRGLQIDDRMEHAVLEASSRQLGEEPLDRVWPGARRRDEVEGPARVALQPGAYLGVLIRDLEHGGRNVREWFVARTQLDIMYEKRFNVS